MINSNGTLEKEAPKKEKRTRADAGRMGGKATKQRYGPDFFRRIGQSGGRARGKKHRDKNGEA